jgi:hypothetical protein
MAREHELAALAKKVAGERAEDAKKLAPLVFGTAALPDSEPMARGQFLEYVRSGWGVPEFRKSLLKRYGAQRFKEIAREALGAPEGAPEAAGTPRPAAEPLTSEVSDGGMG